MLNEEPTRHSLIAKSASRLINLDKSVSTTTTEILTIKPSSSVSRDYPVFFLNEI